LKLLDYLRKFNIIAKQSSLGSLRYKKKRLKYSLNIIINKIKRMICDKCSQRKTKDKERCFHETYTQKYSKLHSKVST
jgi:hypothetical protein